MWEEEKEKSNGYSFHLGDLDLDLNTPRTLLKHEFPLYLIGWRKKSGPTKSISMKFGRPSYGMVF